MYYNHSELFVLSPNDRTYVVLNELVNCVEEPNVMFCMKYGIIGRLTILFHRVYAIQGCYSEELNVTNTL